MTTHRPVPYSCTRSPPLGSQHVAPRGPNSRGASDNRNVISLASSRRRCSQRSSEDPQPPRLCFAFAFDHFSIDRASVRRTLANSAEHAEQRKNTRFHIFLFFIILESPCSLTVSASSLTHTSDVGVHRVKYSTSTVCGVCARRPPCVAATLFYNFVKDRWLCYGRPRRRVIRDREPLSCG